DRRPACAAAHTTVADRRFRHDERCGGCRDLRERTLVESIGDADASLADRWGAARLAAVSHPRTDEPGEGAAHLDGIPARIERSVDIAPHRRDSSAAFGTAYRR